MTPERGVPETPKIEPREGQLETPLRRYIASFGLDPIRDLLPQDIAVFAAAMKLEKHIEHIKIPTAKKKSEQQQMIVVEELVEKQIPRTTYLEGEEPSDIPADTMNVGPIQSMRQLPEIMPGEWLREEVDESQFLEKAASNQLLRREWYARFKRPVTSYDTIQQKELVEKPAPPEDEKRHAYVLLDVSGSMNYEGKDVAAKGLTLAFLRKGFMERSHLHVRPFEGYPHNLIEGQTDEEFKKITTTVLRKIVNGGGTDIQRALEYAVSDINAGGEFVHADILLITDGLSELDGNPLGKINLHTLMLGFDGDYTTLSSRSRQSIRALEAWSKTFKAINTDEFTNPHNIDQETKELTKESLRSLPDRFPRNTPQDIRNVIKNYNDLYEALQTAHQLRDKAHYNNSEFNELSDIISQLSDMANPSHNQELLKQKLQEEKDAQELAEQMIEEQRKANRRSTRDALSELDQLTGNPSKVEIPQPDFEQRRDIPRPDISETPEEARRKLDQLAGKEPQVTMPEAQQPMRTTQVSPSEFEQDASYQQQAKAGKETQNSKAQKQTKRPAKESRPAPSQPEDDRNEALEELQKLTGQKPNIDYPDTPQEQQRRKNLIQRIIEKMLGKKS